MPIDWKYESAAGQAQRQLQAAAERYYQRGLTAADDAWCPYPETSFAAIHWRRGQKQGVKAREQSAENQ